MSKTVYAISSGWYSDYSIERIFERLGDAESYVTLMGGENTCPHLRIEEFDFHPSGEQPTVYTEYIARCHPERQDEIVQTSELTTDKPKHIPLEDLEPGHTYFACLGPDKERVLKSVSDRLAKWKADQAGIA